MGSTRRAFTPEYKEQSVAFVIDGGRPVAEVARNIGVHEMTLSKWVKVAREAAESGKNPDAPLGLTADQENRSKASRCSEPSQATVTVRSNAVTESMPMSARNSWVGESVSSQNRPPSVSTRTRKAARSANSSPGIFTFPALHARIAGSSGASRVHY